MRRLSSAVVIALLLCGDLVAQATVYHIPNRGPEELKLAASRGDSGEIEIVITGATDQQMVRVYENGKMILEERGDKAVHVVRDAPIAGTYTYRAEAVDEAKVRTSPKVRVTVPGPNPSSLRDGNGIAVGKAKTFDDRALMEMLEETVANLALAQSTFIDPAALRANIGAFQGGEATATAVAVSASTLPLPATEQSLTRTVTANVPRTDTVVNTGGDDGDTTQTTNTGATQTTTDTTTDKTTRAAFTPSPPEAPEQTSSFATDVAFGIAPADLLAQQVELASEAANLRLLLQRALSDKALIERPGDGDAKFDRRLQVVLGFQISVEPLQHYPGAVAEAIIRITPKQNYNRLDGGPSLVALMPQEKSYNIATIRKASQAFSLGGVVQALNIGASVNRTRDALYLVKDTDTVALERVPSGGEGVEFAWQFRPVLDQKTVRAGARHVFAVLSLPAGAKEDWVGKVEVQTRWRTYNKRRRAVGEPFLMSTRRQIPYELRLDSIENQAIAVAPKADFISWDEASADTVFVTLTGHFPLNTRVAAGDLVVGPGPTNGVVVATERRLTFAVPALKLFLGDLTLIDRYGKAAPVVYENPEREKERKTGFQDLHATAAPAGPGVSEVTVYFHDELSLHDHRPLFRIGQSVFGLSNAPATKDTVTLKEALACDHVHEDRQACDRHRKDQRVDVLKFRAPQQLVADAPTVQVIDPFWGNNFNFNVPIKILNAQSATTASEVKLIGVTDAKITLAVIGDKLSEAMTIRLGDSIVPKHDITTTPSLLVLTIDRARFAGARHLVLVPYGEDSAPPIVLPLPLAELTRPRIIRHTAVREGHSGGIRLDGVDLRSVKQIRFNNDVLTFAHDDVRPESSIYVHPTAALIGQAGEKELTVVAADGTVQSFVVVVSKGEPKKDANS